MPNEVVNLKQARKKRKRAAKASKAKANREKFGRTKTEKVLAERDADTAKADLDGHKLEKPEA
ncbi:MAG: DUF4169 family protein [Pseudomonadota bacterium]